MALHNTSPYVTHSYPHGPMAWTSYKIYFHYRPVYPSSDSSMHLNLHKNATKRIKPKYTPDSVTMTKQGVKVLDKQRPRIQHFIGIKEYKAKDIDLVSDRLAKYDPVRFPAEGRGLVTSLPAIDACARGKRVYTGEDVQRIVERLATHQSLDKDQMEQLQQRMQEGYTPRKMTTGELDKLVKRLSAYDPQLGPANSRGMSARKPDLSDLTGKNKSASSGEIEQIVDRLAKFDPEKWPPGSPSKGAAQPPRSSTSSKKLNQGELGEVFERLASYDRKRWPAESVGTKSDFYQGKPQKFKNH